MNERALFLFSGGIGLAADDPRALDRLQWRGLNLLGQSLTQVREALLWEQGLLQDR